MNTKAKRLQEMKAEEAKMAAAIDEAVASSGVTLDEDEGVAPRRWFCGLFSRRSPRAAAPGLATGSSTKAAKPETAAERAVFGTRKKQSTAEAASARLNAAAASVAHHAETLGERAGAARAKARELMAAGKKAEAMLALKRSKALDKQAETATATQVALEQQVDVMESSALQKEVASALSASVASTKMKTKGLLGKTETAVDDAQELKDFSEDIAQVLSTMQTDDMDDDELASELDAMVHDHEQSVRETAPTVAPVPESGTAAAVRSFPKVPQVGTARKYARLDEIVEEGVQMS